LYSGRDRDSYVQERRVIRAGILVYGGYGAVPSPYAMYLLSSGSVYVPLGGQGFEFYPPRPPGWEIINPLALPGLDKSQPAYWAINMGVTPLDLSLLENFDLLLLPVMGTGAGLTAEQQQALERWVDEGGLLWVDNQPDHPNPGDNPQLGGFFLRPAVQFGVRNRPVPPAPSPRVAIDPNHPLLRSRYALSNDELQWLGQQYAYSVDPAGLSPLDGIVGGVNNPNLAVASVTIPQEVVGDYDTATGADYPIIAAGRYGDGCIVLTACGVAAAISDWYAHLTAASPVPQTATELPQWALPDMKLAYNMIQWWMDWSGAHGRVRSRGEYPGSLPTPPLLAWGDVETLSGALGGPVSAGRGLAFAGSASGVLGAWDTRPHLDRDLRDTPNVPGAIGGSPEIKSDDGAIDYAVGAGRDLLWSVTVPWQDPNDANPRTPEPARQVVGAPAIITTYDGARPRRLVAVAVKTADEQDCSLHAYLADATDADGIVNDPAYPNVLPVWSATVKHYARPDPQDNNGLVSCGPVAVDSFLALLTTDSGTLEAPNRDAHLNIYDAAGPRPAVAPDMFEWPAASLEITRAGRAASFYNSPAVARIGAYDAFWQPAAAQPVEAAVMTGNSLPRPGPSAVGWLYVTPLMVRVPAPGWDQTWVADLNASGTVDDISADQTVQVYFPNAYGNPGGTWIQVPPHMSDPAHPGGDPAQPLNYVRSVSGGQISITFTNWSMFGWGPASDNKYPLGFGDIWIRYRDTQGNWRDLRPLSLTPGTPTALNGLLNGVGSRTASVSGFVNEGGHATPCVGGDRVYVGSDAVNADPSPSSEGQLASYSLAAPHVGDLQWRFIGDRYRGQAPGPGGYYFSSFSFTPAYAGDTLFAVSNYQFFRDLGGQSNQSIVPSGAMYALDVKASPELVSPGTASPVFPNDIDASAPPNDGVNSPPFSADPNQVVPPGRAGAAVWISTSLTDTSPRYAIPQVSGGQANWRVDTQNNIIRLGPGVFGDLACPVWDAAQGRYVPQQVRVRYFSAGALQEQVMDVAPMVRWMYLAPDGWGLVSSPVVAGDTVMVVAYDNGMQRYLLLGFPAAPEATTDDPYPLWAFAARPEFVQVLATGVPAAAACSLAVADEGIVWSGSVAGVGGVAGLESPETVIADTDRLLAADAGGRALTVQDAAWHMRPETTPGLGGIPINYSYADMTFDSLNRPARVRTLPNGNLLVVDSGAGSVVELDGARQVVWRYPNDDPAADRGGMTAEQARLLDPSDAQRYYYQQSVTLADVFDPEGLIQAGSKVRVEWETTLIADTGNYRVLEVARPLVNGRYRPDLENGARTARLYVELVREIAAPAITQWPTATGITSIQAAFTTVARLDAADAPYQYLSSSIRCAVSNAPPDPLGRDGSVRLVEIAPYAAQSGQPLAGLAVNRVVGRGSEGINVFRARTSPWALPGPEQFARDFLGIRQADQTVVPGPVPGIPVYQTLVVDDVGVKVLDNATWNTTLTSVFEMRGPAPAAPEAALTSYQQEMAGLRDSLQLWATDPATTGVYPPPISEPRLGLSTAAWNARRASALAHLNAYAQTGAAGGPAGEIQFLPTFARRLRNGMYLIVNGYPNPYLSGGPLDVMAPTASEVLRVDPLLPVGQRIVRTLDQQTGALDLYTWDHFIVPDPGRSEYPRLRGGAAPLRQPRAADMR
jgi:hypothetical protein